MIQHIVILIAMTVYIERIPSQVSKGKRHIGKVQGNQTQLPRVFSQGSHQQLVTTHVESYLSEPLIRDLLRDLLETQLETCQRLRFLFRAGHRGNFCIKIPNSQKESWYSAQIPCLYNSDTMSCCYLGMMEIISKVSFPDASWGSTQQSKIEVLGLLCYIFCTCNKTNFASSLLTSHHQVRPMKPWKEMDCEK